jgi:hypothetical protein
VILHRKTDDSNGCWQVFHGKGVNPVILLTALAAMVKFAQRLSWHLSLLAAFLSEIITREHDTESQDNSVVQDLSPLRQIYELEAFLVIINMH